MSLSRTPSFTAAVVQRIFSFFSTTLSTDDLTQFPWFLGHICSTWRSVYLSMTSELWHSISIIFGPKCTHTTISVVLFFLERDPEAPFSFHFEYPHEYPYSLSEFTQQQVGDIRYILEMLVDESSRWEDAYFFSRATDLLPLVLLKNRLPLLRALRLSLIDAFDEVPDLLYEVFDVAPSLELLYLENLADWKFNWSNLKEITTASLGSGAFITAFPQMTKLERLMIYRACIPPLTNVIIYPFLTTLCCHISWLPFLTAPALTGLTLDFLESGPSDSNSDSTNPSSLVDIALTFLRRSSCNILHLGIESTRGAVAIEIIKETPHITHLELVAITNTGRVFEELTISSTSAQEVLARRMVSLEVYDDDDNVTNHDLDPLCELVSSRTANNHGHKKLERLDLQGRMPRVSGDKFVGILTLCEERGVLYNE